MPIRHEDISSFDRQGFVRGPHLLPPDRLAAVRRAVDAIAAEESPGMTRVLAYRRHKDRPASQIHVVGAWLAEEALEALVTDATVVDWARQLMGTACVRLFRDQLFIKPGDSDGIVPWHQDYSDWTHTAPARHLTCWIALDDATIQSGCLHYLRGTHRGPLLPKITAKDDFTSAAERLPSRVEASEPMEVPAGHCVFHDCLTIHGSYANTTSIPRRAIAVAYMHPLTRSVSSRQVLPGSPLFDEGQLIEGDLFPLLGAGQ